MKNQKQILDNIFQLAHDEYNKDGYEVLIVELLRPYLKLRPDHGSAWLLYGDALRIIGRSSEALPVLKKALDMAPETEKYHIYGKIALLHETYISPIEAKKWYELATECETESLDWLWLLKGANLAVLGEFEKGISCFQKVIGLNTDLKDEAFVNMGLAYRAIGQYKKAINSLNQAIEINPDNEEAKSILEGLLKISTIQETLQQIDI